MNQDDAGYASGCTAQTTPGTGADPACSLRDALTFAHESGSGSITFDGTVFSASNTAAQNTIFLGPTGTLTLPVNTSMTASGSGGAIAAISSLTVQASSLVRNSAGQGGAIFASATTMLSGNLFSGNSATSDGGAISVSGSPVVTNNTFTANTAPKGSAIFSLSATLANNLVLLSPGQTASTAIFALSSSYSDARGNIISATAGPLSPVCSYGGATPAILPLPGSAAICAGTLANAQAAGITSDQRGFPLNPACPAGLSIQERCRATMR